MKMLICSAAWLLCCICTQAQGSFHYTQHGERLSTLYANVFDLNSDGRTDVSIDFRNVSTPEGDSWYIGFEGRLSSGTRLLTDSYYFESATILETGGATISHSIPVRTDLERPAAGGSGVNWLGDIPVTWFSLGGLSSAVGRFGIYEQSESILGFQVQGNDGYHNGWMRIELREASDAPGVYVTDWAFNLTPGDPIVAGLLQVPEPSVVFLLFTGVLTLLAFCRRTKRNTN